MQSTLRGTRIPSPGMTPTYIPSSVASSANDEVDPWRDHEGFVQTPATTDAGPITVDSLNTPNSDSSTAQSGGASGKTFQSVRRNTASTDSLQE